MGFSHSRARSCEDYGPLISAWLDNELSPSDASLVERHLQLCQRCTTDFDALKGCCEALRDVEDVAMPHGLQMAIRAAIRVEEAANECERLRPLLSAFVDAELATHDRERVCIHLDHCVPCRELLAQARRVASLVGSLPSCDPPAGLRERVLASTSGSRRPLPIYAFAGFAATAALVLLLVPYGAHDTTQPIRSVSMAAVHTTIEELRPPSGSTAGPLSSGSIPGVSMQGPAGMSTSSGLFTPRIRHPEAPWIVPDPDRGDGNAGGVDADSPSGSASDSANRNPVVTSGIGQEASSHHTLVKVASPSEMSGSVLRSQPVGLATGSSRGSESARPARLALRSYASYTTRIRRDEATPVGLSELPSLSADAVERTPSNASTDPGILDSALPADEGSVLPSERAGRIRPLRAERPSETAGLTPTRAPLIPLEPSTQARTIMLKPLSSPALSVDWRNETVTGERGTARLNRIVNTYVREAKVLADRPSGAGRSLNGYVVFKASAHSGIRW